MPSRNPFAVLGLPLDASADAIKAAWRRLARTHHPDVTSGDPGVERRATRQMAEINAAYQELRDPEKRRLHREAVIRSARPGVDAAGRGDAANGGASAGNGEHGAAPGDWRAETYGSPGWVPRPRPTRPVTARIDTSEFFRPRNTTLHPLNRSPLPGLPPRPRTELQREGPRASEPTGPTLHARGRTFEAELPSLAEALSLRLDFGKFEGRTLAEVAMTEPSYIDWIARTVARAPELTLAARVVLRYLEASGVSRRRRLDSVTPGS